MSTLNPGRLADVGALKKVSFGDVVDLLEQVGGTYITDRVELVRDEDQFEYEALLAASVTRKEVVLDRAGRACGTVGIWAFETPTTGGGCGSTPAATVDPRRRAPAPKGVARFARAQRSGNACEMRPSRRASSDSPGPNG